MLRRKILNLSYTRNKICVRVCVRACTKRSFVLEEGVCFLGNQKIWLRCNGKRNIFFFLFSPHIFLSLDFLSFWRVEKMKKRKKIRYFFSPVYKTTITTTITTTTATCTFSKIKKIRKTFWTYNGLNQRHSLWIVKIIFSQFFFSLGKVLWAFL